MATQAKEFTQVTGAAIEREALHCLPRLLADLLDEPVLQLEPERWRGDGQIDFATRDTAGRQWLIEVKNSSRPGQVADAAEQLLVHNDGHVIPLLVVPYMSRAGAQTADRARLNWLDLSGDAHIRADGLHVRQDLAEDDEGARRPGLASLG